MSTRDAIRAMCRFKSDKRFDSVCALDVAEKSASPRDVATMLGTGMGTMRREAREARFRVGMHFWIFKPWNHPECWDVS